MIQFINVNKRFDDMTVLEDINLEIASGTILGLVGKNGSGKSTLLRLVAGILEADAGLVTIRNQPIYDNPKIKKDVFLVSDDPYFFVQSTLKEMRRFYEIFYPSFDGDKYESLLKLFEISDLTKISTLSKGQKRQISLIFALSAKPRILLLDEAFDGLDPIMRFKFKQLLGDCIIDHNATIIISSHNLRELEDLCDSIAFIDNKNVALNQSSETFHRDYHKFQVAFDTPQDLDSFTFLNALNIAGNSQLFTFVLKGDLECLIQELQTLKPMLIEHNAVTLEEIFVYEMEAKTHDRSL